MNINNIQKLIYILANIYMNNNEENGWNIQINRVIYDIWIYEQMKGNRKWGGIGLIMI